MHKKVFGDRAVPSPTGGAYSVLQSPSPLRQGRTRKGGREWTKGEERGSPSTNSWIRQC